MILVILFPESEPHMVLQSMTTSSNEPCTFSEAAKTEESKVKKKKSRAKSQKGGKMDMDGGNIFF